MSLIQTNFDDNMAVKKFFEKLQLSKILSTNGEEKKLTWFQWEKKQPQNETT